MARHPTLTLRPGRDASLRRRHPWVFSGSVATRPTGAEPGSTVALRAADGRFLAWAAYNPTSQIVARVWSFDEHDVIDEAFVTGRLDAAVARRAHLSARTTASRLVFSESDGLPGLIADRYADTVVVELTTAGADRWRGAIAAYFAGLDGVSHVYERSDLDMRDREGIPRRSGPLTPTEPPERIEIVEDDHHFLLDVRAGHKTGFYLDQRDSRQAVAALAPGRRTLNMFAYTGAFSVVAAQAGSTDVVSVDSSAPALDLARHNLARNGCPPGELVTADAFTELRRRRDRGERFDLIILDPPKLALRAHQLDRSTRAYKDLNLVASHLLTPGGILVTFSCSGVVSEELFQKVVAGAVLDAGRDARIVGRLHQAADHPVHLAVPETAYLKGLVCEFA